MYPNEPPQSAEALIRKKFLITHFEDDFCFRSYSFREKVFQFLNAVALLEIDERDPKQRDKILDRLTQNRESELAHVLGHFSRDESLRNMSGRRAALAHRISLRDIRELSQTQRYLEWLSWNPELNALEERDEVDIAISSFQIDEVRNQAYQRLAQMTRGLEKFSQDFCAALIHSLSPKSPGMLH